MVSLTCDKRCCQIKYCPLVPAFGRTIHSFQGQEAGPGKPIESIIVNPGSKAFEIINPGTLNCCITRASTLGNKDDYSDSAIYFQGPNINHHRFENMTCSNKGKIHQKIAMRNKWINHLNVKRQETEKFISEISQDQYDKFHEYENKTLTLEMFDRIIQYHIECMNNC